MENLNIVNPEAIGNPNVAPIVEVPQHMLAGVHEAINGNRRGAGMPPMEDTPCRLCSKPVGTDADPDLWRTEALAWHRACLDTKHTFYSVKLDGMGGPGFDERAHAEAFIAEDLANGGDAEYTADDYTIHPFEETWRENFARGEWDGW